MRWDGTKLKMFASGKRASEIVSLEFVGDSLAWELRFERGYGLQGRRQNWHRSGVQRRLKGLAHRSCSAVELTCSNDRV